MKAMNHICLLGFSLVITLASSVFGQNIITFDDLAGGSAGHTPPNIPNGYQGLNWNNIGVFNTTGFPPSGFVNGTVSQSNVAVGGYINPTSFSASSPFILVSGDFTSAHQNGMSLEITGLNGTTTVFDKIFTLNLTGPSFLTFPASPITEVDFVASGGVDVMGYLGGGPEMVLDNLTIAPVPELATEWLVAAGFFTMALLRQKRLFRL